MSSPDFLVACCISNSSTNELDLHPDKDTVHLMNIVTLVMSVFSLGTVIYLLLPRGDSRSDAWNSPGRLLVGPNLNSIIKCIVLSNCLATVGLLVRSSVWISRHYPSHKIFISSNVACVVLTIWIQYFFLCNFLWHIVYSIEVFLVANKKEFHTILKYTLGWFIPCCLCCANAGVAYYPGLDRCFPSLELNRNLGYLFFLLPVVLFWLFSPWFFRVAAKEAKNALIWQYGRFTSSERKLVDAIQMKFIVIFISFLLCWLPNILNAILRMTNSDISPDGHETEALKATWVFMGFVNPLQVVLAAVVFWGIPKRAICWGQVLNINQYSHTDASSVNFSVSRTQSHHSVADETEPLISFRRKGAL